MATLATRLSDLITRTGTELKAIRILIGGSGTSTVSGLNTTATNLVAAVNEVKVTADAAGGGGMTTADIDTLAEINAIITDATLIDTSDARLSDARTPTAHTHVLADVTDSGTLAAKSTIETADITDAQVTLPKLAASVQTSLGLADTATQPADLVGLATEGYADTAASTAVAGVVDSSPATLDTLNELAAALGDDANFATTMTTALGNRVRTDTAAQGLTGTQQTNARTNILAQSSAAIGDPDVDLVALFNAAIA